MALGHPTNKDSDTYESQQFGPASPNAAGYLSQPPLWVVSNIVAWWTEYKDFTYHPHVHNGLDVAGPAGHPLRALERGTVRNVGWRFNGGGLVIEVEIRPGTHYTFNHCSGFPENLGEGDIVQKGQVIAYIGQTGVATGYHCHVSLDIDERGSDYITRRLVWNPKLFMADGPYANDPRIRPELPPVELPDTSAEDPDLPILENISIPGDTGRLFSVKKGVVLRTGPGPNYPQHWKTTGPIKYTLLGFSPGGWVAASNPNSPTGIFFVPPVH